MADSKIVEVCKVTPPPGSPTDMCIPLTFFDLFCLRFSPSKQIYFYETRHPEPVFTGSVLPRLKQSLSLTLKYFLPLAGSLTWPSSSPNPVICYKEGDGVLFTVAVTDDADFNHLTSKNKRESKIFRPLVARIDGSDHSRVPVLALKVTVFPNKGFCIGVTAHHCLFDANSMLLFIKAWASISKFGENKKGLGPELIPVFVRKTVREQYMDIENSYIEFLKHIGISPNRLALREFEPRPDTFRVTFELTGIDVRKLKELARARLERCGEGAFSQVPYISTFTVSYAYVILCLVKAKGQMAAMNRIHIAFSFDCRSRLEPPLPENYFGNCIGTFATYIDKEDLLGEDLMTLLLKFIIKSIQGLEEKGGALRGAEEWLPNLFEADADAQTTKIYVAGSSKFKLHSVDFGWGKPRKADRTLIDGTGGITFADGDGGGIEIELSLIYCEIERFASVFAQGVTELSKFRSSAL